MVLLQNEERMRTHREALKQRLHISGLNLEELEYACRLMVMSGRFTGSAGVPETMLMPHLPEKFLTSPPSPSVPSPSSPRACRGCCASTSRCSGCSRCPTA
jgi:hypothetical protein